MTSLDEQPAPQFATAEFDGLADDSHALFVRGLLFGAGGALLGLALYATVGIITGLEIGLVALAVGWLVGKAVVTGSKGRTGRRYQISAVVLTYLAVSLSTVPIALYYLAFQPELIAEEIARDAAETPSQEIRRWDSNAQPPGTVSTSETFGKTEPPAVSQEPDLELIEDGEPISLLAIAGTLAWFGLISPFASLTDGSGGAIGLLILAFGLRIAWQVAGGTAAAVRETLAGAEGPGGPGDKPTTLNLGR